MTSHPTHVGFHASDVNKLLAKLRKLVDAGNSAVMIEYDIRLVLSTAQAQLPAGGGGQGCELHLALHLATWIYD